VPAGAGVRRTWWVSAPNGQCSKRAPDDRCQRGRLPERMEGLIHDVVRSCPRDVFAAGTCSHCLDPQGRNQVLNDSGQRDMACASPDGSDETTMLFAPSGQLASDLGAPRANTPGAELSAHPLEETTVQLGGTDIFALP
jgi:hypothetical protein